MFRRRQIKKTFTHGMTHHVVSKGLANPSLLWGVRLRVANHRNDEERADIFAPVATPLYMVSR